MNKTFTFLVLAITLTFFTASSTFSQVVSSTDTTVLPPPPPIHQPINYNSGFDVIIKRSGEIIYGLVKEVGLQLIKYQRTDIPDGPIYTIPRFEVYAISYRNQVKEYLNPADDPALMRPPVRYNSNRPYSNRPYNYNLNQRFLLQQGAVRIGLGFIRGFTKVKNANEYSSSAGFPVVIIGYDALYRSPIRLGVQLAFGSHKFSKQEYSEYDSTQSNVTLKENVFTLHLYGKYNLLTTASAFQPYAIIGLGITSSNVKSDYAINFVDNADKVILVKSGARSVGLGILARIGTDYAINNQLRIFGDIGAGPSLINIGVSVNVQ